MTSTPIRFVYFDLGNILVAFDREVAARNVAELFHANPTEVELAFVNEIMHDSGLQNQLETGLVSEAEFAEAIRKSFPGTMDPIDDAAILRAISDMFTPIETMTDVLGRVRQTGMPIGILSNTCQAHWSWVRSQSYGVLQGPFDVEVVSYEARSMKPDRMIYEVAEARARDINQAKPEEILFVDDREENVMAARQYGWNAEVCWGGATAEEVLVRYGVLPECRLITEPLGMSS
ncbi:HAD family hydrolase [Neorhodopirellula pilleata]|nr:HAD family phosphatase [Neorhodopirellula pilleata]